MLRYDRGAPLFFWDLEELYFSPKKLIFESDFRGGGK